MTHFLVTSCYGLNVLSPQNSYVEILTPKVMVFESEAASEGTKITRVEFSRKRLVHQKRPQRAS